MMRWGLVRQMKKKRRELRTNWRICFVPVGFVLDYDAFESGVGIKQEGSGPRYNELWSESENVETIMSMLSGSVEDGVSVEDQRHVQQYFR